MAVTLTPISIPFDTARKTPPPGLDLGAVFDAIVVGSGYGGAISAAKLALAGQRVLLLERGREILPGQYPRSLQEAAAETQITTATGGRLTSANGMLDLRINDDMSVVLGCGLGGTSLLNANVALEPDPRLFAATELGPGNTPRPVWPIAFRGPLPAGASTPLDAEYAEARTGLSATPYPEDWPQLGKMTALAVSADAMGLAVERMPIAVSFRDGPNAFGNQQAACTLCGDCCSGCNYGAKNTTLMNYLPLAAANGAVLLSEAQVHTVLPDGTDWVVRTTGFGQPANTGLDLRARLVVLAAGTLGSTEILQRSARAGLPVAQGWLGRGFSGNGDVLGFGFNANFTRKADGDSRPIYSIGAGLRTPDPADPASRPGPCITGMIRVDMGPDDPLRSGVLIEDGVAPGPLAMAYPAIFFGDDATTAGLTRFPDAQRRIAALAALGTDLINMKGIDTLAYDGVMARMQSYLLMSHDDAAGQIVYDPDRDGVSVVWPNTGRTGPFARDNALLSAASDAIWADYLPNPMWSEAFGWQVVTTHPIGGCRMADSPEAGVVDSDCRVFSGLGDAVHEGLMVCDGAVIPGSLGVNPFLTISAVTIRAMDRLVARRGWTPNPNPAPASSSRPAPPVAPPADGLGALAAVIATAQDWLSSRATRIGAGQADQVRDEIVADLRALADRYPFGERVLLRGAIDLAEWSADMTGDIGPALSILASYLDKIHGILIAGKPEAEILSALAAYVGKLTGDISTSLQFTETMEGWLGPAQPAGPHPLSDPYRIAEGLGRAEGRRVTVTCTVFSPDLDALRRDPDRRARLTGGLTLTDPVTGKSRTHLLHDGSFQLLPQDGDRVDCWHMIYDATLDDGRRFHGFKTLQRRDGSNWWTDLTTLSVDLGSGEGALQGVMTLSVQDLLRQSLTIKGDLPAPRSLVSLVLWMLGDVHRRHFHDLVAKADFLNAAARLALNDLVSDGVRQAVMAEEGLVALTEAGGAVDFATLIFRSYGGLAAYLYNFPLQDAPTDPIPTVEKPALSGTSVSGKWYRHITPDGSNLQLTRFKGGRLGPVILANGFGFRGLGFAMATTPTSITAELVRAGYDVWIFDHRASPAALDHGRPPNLDYTMDDIAAQDWPWAIGKVLETRRAEGPDPGSVQVLAHCLGGLTAMMALQGGHARNVRQMIVSQFTTQPVAGWFNQMKADLGLARFIRDGVDPALAAGIAQLFGIDGLKDLLKQHDTFDLRSAPPPADPSKPLEGQALIDLMVDVALWQVPFPPGETCYSPTCHRVFGVFGPVYRHAQLNAATHDALGAIAGPVATYPFQQLARMMQLGRAVDARGRDVYFDRPERLDFPIHFISGALNQLVMPETTLLSQRWLQKALPDSADKFTRQVFEGYGHLDCLIGRDAARDVFPSILAVLARHADPDGTGTGQPA